MHIHISQNTHSYALFSHTYLINIGTCIFTHTHTLIHLHTHPLHRTHIYIHAHSYMKPPKRTPSLVRSRQSTYLWTKDVFFREHLRSAEESKHSSLSIQSGWEALRSSDLEYVFSLWLPFMEISNMSQSRKNGKWALMHPSSSYKSHQLMTVLGSFVAPSPLTLTIKKILRAFQKEHHVTHNYLSVYL